MQYINGSRVQEWRRFWFHLEFIYSNDFKDNLSLKSESPELFKDTIPVIRTFHQQMFYIYAVYKRLQGSGMEVVLVLSGVLAGGSVEKPERKALQKGCEIHPSCFGGRQFSIQESEKYFNSSIKKKKQNLHNYYPKCRE